MTMIFLRFTRPNPVADSDLVRPGTVSTKTRSTCRFFNVWTDATFYGSSNLLRRPFFINAGALVLSTGFSGLLYLGIESKDY